MEFGNQKNSWKQLRNLFAPYVNLISPANSDFAMVNAQSIDRLKCLLFETLSFTLYENDQCKIFLAGFGIQNQSPLPQQKLHQFRPFCETKSCFEYGASPVQEY